MDNFPRTIRAIDPQVAGTVVVLDEACRVVDQHVVLHTGEGQVLGQLITPVDSQEPFDSLESALQFIELQYVIKGNCGR